MIGVFVRELRENLKWATLIFGALLVMVVRELRGAETMLLFQLAHQYTVWMAPLAGLLMGVVQSLFEIKPDNWSFVVHRPVQRGAIFAAKCLAGLLLLYTALLLPCLIATIWAGRPGNLAVPFQGRMVLPMIADVLNGGCYYFAGLVLTLRRARWFGSRLLPLGLVLAGSAVITMLVAPFWQALLIILVVQSIGAVAAWGVFSTHGAADESWITRAALGAMIYPGAIGVGVVLVGFSQAFMPHGAAWRYYQIDRHGGVVLVSQTVDRGERGATYSDTTGTPLREYDGLDLDDPANRDQFVRFGAHLVDSDFAPWPMNVIDVSGGYRTPHAGVIPLRGGARGGTRVRFSSLYDVPQHVIDLYDPVTRVQIGTIGPDGFSPAPNPPAGRFPGSPRNVSLLGGSRVLAFDSIVYWIELERRNVRPIYLPAADDPVFSAAELGPPAAPTLLVATRHGLHAMHTDGKLLFSTPWEQDPTQFNYDAALLPSSQHVILRAFSNPGTPFHNEVFEYAADGTLLRRTVLPFLSTVGGTKKLQTMIFGALFPAAARPICPLWIPDDILDLRMQEFSRIFAGFMWGSAVLWAAITLLIGRRCGFGWQKTIGWSVANFLLGPAGIAVVLALNDWPAREICHRCGGARFSGRRDCHHCGAALPPPARDGREIFEPAEDFPPINALQPVA